MLFIVNGELKELELRENGVEFTRDIIGNSTTLNYNDAEECYEMTEDEYDWWNEYIENYKADEAEAEELGISWSDYSDRFTCDMEQEHFVKQGIIREVKESGEEA